MNKDFLGEKPWKIREKIKISKWIVWYQNQTIIQQNFLQKLVSHRNEKKIIQTCMNRPVSLCLST